MTRALPHVKAGAVLVSAEPTATFAFKVHYPDYVNSPDCSLVANATRDLGEFLVQRRARPPRAGPGRRPPAGGPRRCSAPAVAGALLRIGYHQPCHLKAQQIGSPGLELLREIPGVEVVDLAAGCCGMAGTFGMKAGTYDLSMQPARPCSTAWPRSRPTLSPANAAPAACSWSRPPAGRLSTRSRCWPRRTGSEARPI